MKPQQLIMITFVIFILSSIPTNAGIDLSSRSVETSTKTQDSMNQFAPSASTGIPTELGRYIILQETGLSTDPHGMEIQQILDSEGIASSLIEASDLLLDNSPLEGAIAIVCDSSLGSDNGTAISSSLIDLIVWADKPTILLGQSAWLLHQLRGEGPPQQTAPASLYVYTSPAYAGAVFLYSPYTISSGSLLTSESLILPIEKSQSEHSRLINITRASSSSEIALLRYDSYPLDAFLLGMENPSLWTLDGKNLFINTIAYANSLCESMTTQILSQTQTTDDLFGGFAYYHETSIELVYFAISALYETYDSSSWSNWVLENSGFVKSILDDFYMDLGTEAGFMNTASLGTMTVRSTSQGIVVASLMNLTASYDSAKLVNYLSSQQVIDGGFGDIVSTYYASQALYELDSLSSINTIDLETWLRDCVVTGLDTSDPNRWGGVAYIPSSPNPQNNYATMYLMSLSFLGKVHDDPGKLTNWILTRTANIDGSYDNTLSDGSEIMVGTASALMSMELLGTLSSSNRTSGVNWIATNQLPSGGFGIDILVEDIFAKTEETSIIAKCFEILAVTNSTLLDGIIRYMTDVKTDVGFEGMEFEPSLMWGYWISDSLRYTHGGSYIDKSAANQYLNYFTTWAQYPNWDNISAFVTPEYMYNQYTTKGVWTQYFGILMANALGIPLSPSMISETIGRLDLSQYITGHYRPTFYSGTAHMQYSVAAVETLYLLDALDSINYRSALDSAILSEYVSGSWDTSGWTLNPYVGTQSAIDWLSTRAALRLNLIDSTMAAEIAGVISSRIQYEDLWALSRDVATLALLNSTFTVGLDTIDEEQVILALDGAFADGWFNSSGLWQPIFTQGVLEMISILGIRPQISNPLGSTCNISMPTEISLAEPLDIGISISSLLTTHSVYVNAFNEWIRFDDVSNSDVLSLSIPSSIDSIGHQSIYVMVWDYNSSRSYDSASIDVLGSLSGLLEIESSAILVGDLINGSAAWSLESGGDAGIANITLRLENGVQYQEWYYTQSSPLEFSVPTEDFSSGTHNLSVLISVSNCDNLLLQTPVTIEAPYMTYLDTDPMLFGDVLETISVPWSLHFQENDSFIPDQLVSIVIEDISHAVVHTDSQISSNEISYFNWTPSLRGNYTFHIEFNRNGTLESSSISGSIDVYEDSEIVCYTDSVINQYDTILVTLQLRDISGTGLAGYQVNIQVTSPNAIVIYNSSLITNATGYVSFFILFDVNGNYILYATFDGYSLLHQTTSTFAITAWSESYLTVGGIGSEGLVNTTWNLWFTLIDSIGNPIIGEIVELRVIYLPSTIVFETTLTTNATGGGSIQWTADSPGSYQIEVTFSETQSRQSAYDSAVSYLRIPVTLSIVEVSGYLVGDQGWCLIRAVNHDNQGINGLEVLFVVRDPSGGLFYQVSAVTSNGYANITWTPGIRGLNAIYLSSSRSSFYEAASMNLDVEVFDQSHIDLYLIGEIVAVSNVLLRIEVSDSQSAPVEGIIIHTIATLDGIEISNNWSTSSQAGTIEISLQLSNPGNLQIQSSLSSQDWLIASSNEEYLFVKGSTSLDIDANGLPISQGTTVGYLALLLNWESVPLSGSTVIFQVRASNGSILRSVSRTTGADGTCAFAHTFNQIGDFIIQANYSGSSDSAGSFHQIIQRVTVSPELVISHSPTSLLGDSVDIQIGIKDNLDAWISGISLQLTIRIDGLIVFNSITPSSAGLLTLHWSPSQRGQAAIELSYSGSTYILAASINSSLSILEQVSGSLILSPGSIDLGNETLLIYELTSTGELSGVEIQFEILDSDLVPIWTSYVNTNNSGIAEVSYSASTATGVLTVIARPSEDQFLIGGDSQNQLVVMTYCHASTALTPAPASLGGPLNISISCIDDLGTAIDGLSIRVYLYYLGQPIKLGYLTNYITKTTQDGEIQVEFTPTYSGSYQVVLESSGSLGIHAFSYQAYHIVHNPTTIEFAVLQTDIEVGNNIHVIARLTNYYGNAMVGHTILLSIDSLISPVSLTTNNTGYVEWNAIMSEEGLWTLRAQYSGVGVYLPSSLTSQIDVRYGTQIIASRTDNTTIIANQVPVSVAVLLEDTGGSPLEGRTIQYQIYHDSEGWLSSGSFVQTGQTAQIVNITLDRMGDHTIIFSFAGTDHYHPSSAAIVVFVVGTSKILITGESVYDRSSNESITITLVDELDNVLDPGSLNLQLECDGILIDITSRLNESANSIAFNTTWLNVGRYLFDIHLDSTSTRLGYSIQYYFNVTTTSSLIQAESTLSGLLGQTHTACIEVRDSIHALISDAEIYVSIFNPEGKEIYGSILSTKTLVVTESGYAEIEWTPTKTGNYTIIIEYEGTEFIESSSLTLIIKIRYETNLDVSAPESINYPDSGRLMVTLSGGLGKVSGAEIRIRIVIGDLSEEEILLVTDVRGLVQADIDPSYAGNMTIEVEYLGSDIYAECKMILSVLIYPAVDLEISSSPAYYTGVNGSITVAVDIQGLVDSWRGTLNLLIYSNLNELVRNYSTTTKAVDTIILRFVTYDLGIYSILVKISGVPLLGTVNATGSFEITDTPLSIPMDTGSTTVMSSGIILGIIGFALRKKLTGALDNVSVEWDI